MLFDLRGRGRRRTVQAIYLTLAVLMGGGLVFFGIGGNVSGGLFDAIGLGGGGGGGSSASDQLEKQEKAVLRRTRANPRDERAWAVLARIRYQQAGLEDKYDQRTGRFTPDGRRELERATRAWDRYLALEPKDPDATVGILMLQALGPGGLNRPKEGVAAAEIVARARPSAQTYYQWALFAYAAGQARVGDLAGKKAVRLTPKEQRPAVKSQVDAAKKARGFPGVTVR